LEIFYNDREHRQRKSNPECQMTMKKIVPVLLFAFILFSCKKRNGLFPEKRFEGVWEFENFSGYPFNSNYLPPGNGRIIVLLPDGSFERRQQDTVLFRGKYFLNQQKDCTEDQKKTHFTTNDTAYSWDVYIDLASDKLTLTTPKCYADGGTAFYRKVE
jgi:hypothetical protein